MRWKLHVQSCLFMLVLLLFFVEALFLSIRSMQTRVLSREASGDLCVQDVPRYGEMSVHGNSPQTETPAN